MLYIDKFLGFRCASDILSNISPLGRNPSKEISESIGIFNVIRPIIMKSKVGQYSLIDLAAGNSLTSVLCSYMYGKRLASIHAVDKMNRIRKWNNIQNFHRFETTVENYVACNTVPKNDYIIISIHPCRDLAIEITELYLRDKNAKHLIMMPCCVGNIDKFSLDDQSWLTDKYKPYVQRLLKSMSTYEKWVLGLALTVNGKYFEDSNVLSEKNLIIVASKENA